MANQNKNLSLVFDLELELSQGQTTTSSEAGTRSATDQFIDLGANGDETGTVYAVFNVTSADDADADETYVLELECSDTSVFTVVQAQSEVTVVRGESGKYVVAMQPCARYVRAFATVGGTTPSLVWNGFLGITRG